MEGPAWKRQRMEGDTGGGMPALKQDSIFYKTRMCVKCASGHVPHPAPLLVS